MANIRLRIETRNIKVKPSRVLNEEELKGIDFRNPQLKIFWDEDLATELTKVLIKEIEATKF